MQIVLKFLPILCHEPPASAETSTSIHHRTNLPSCYLAPHTPLIIKLFTSQMTGRDLLKDRSLKPMKIAESDIDVSYQ